MMMIKSFNSIFFNSVALRNKLYITNNNTQCLLSILIVVCCALKRYYDHVFNFTGDQNVVIG